MCTDEGHARHPISRTSIAVAPSAGGYQRSESPTSTLTEEKVLPLLLFYRERAENSFTAAAGDSRGDEERFLKDAILM